MASEQKQTPKPEGGDPVVELPRGAGPKTALAAYAVPVALAISVLANLAGVFYFRSLAAQARPVAAQEFSLGNYRFVASDRQSGQVTEARFALHIELLRQAEQPARRLLEARRQKVRQNVEELLRTAHGGDFSDPALRDLKSQLLKRINETLEIRAVADVIVTDLELERAWAPPGPERAPQASVPWVESKAG